MKLWIEIITGAIPAAAAVVVLTVLLLLRRHRRQRQQKLISPQASADFSDSAPKSKFDSLLNSIDKAHLPYKSGSSARNSLRFHHLHHLPVPLLSQPTTAAAFRWDDYPHLITEAAENGWPSFAFSNSIPDCSQPSGSPLWSLCAACDGATQQDSPETGSVFPAGSSEVMQSVRLNSSLNKPADDLPSSSCVRTSLPLPGPLLGGGSGSFPQESYFEITIVFLNHLLPNGSSVDMDRYNDRSKLIRENSISVSHATQNFNFYARSGDLTIGLGLKTRASLPNHSMMPGTYPGSIGFHSNGSLYLDGAKMVPESAKAEWAAASRVIGCGFEPRKKKVFFTVDSNLSHVMRCSSEEYTCPLFPVLAANAEVSVVVNMGQAPFKYAPANAARTPNPCFVQPVAGEEGGEETVGSMDSRELFSVTRMETEWAGRERRVKDHGSHGSLDDALDAESDLFEIALQR